MTGAERVETLISGGNPGTHERGLDNPERGLDTWNYLGRARRGGVDNPDKVFAM